MIACGEPSPCNHGEPTCIRPVGHGGDCCGVGSDPAVIR